MSFTPWRVTLETLAGKINIRLEAAPSMATAFLPIKNGQKKNQRFIPLALLPYIARFFPYLVEINVLKLYNIFKIYLPGRLSVWMNLLSYLTQPMN